MAVVKRLAQDAAEPAKNQAQSQIDVGFGAAGGVCHGAVIKWRDSFPNWLFLPNPSIMRNTHNRGVG